MSGIGHNKGPTMEPGAGWRRYAWKRARAELLPKIPLEVVRMRVRRARELGLDYRTYAGVRATYWTTSDYGFGLDYTRIGAIIAVRRCLTRSLLNICPQAWGRQGPKIKQKSR